MVYTRLIITKRRITMRKHFGSNPWFFPLPVLIIGTYDENGKADAMNAAWGRSV